MPQFTQWNVPDPTPNVMYNQAAIDQAANTTIEGRQKIGAADMEMVGRAAGSLLGMSEEDAATAYPGMVANLQRNGFAMKAPPTYPGHAAVQNIVNSAIPIQQQYEYGILTPPGVTDAIKKSNELLYPNSNTTGTGGGGGAAEPGMPSAGGGPRASLAIGQDQIANAKAIHAGLVARGMDNETALAMAANSLGESGGNWQTTPGDGGASHGLFQWNGDRLAAFQAANGGKLPGQTSLDAQLDFATNEWKADHNGAATAAGRFGTAEGKIAPIVSKYEVSANQPADIARRSAYLNQLRAAGVGLGAAPATSPPFNPNAGPRVAGAPPAGAPSPTATPGFGPITPVPGAPTVTGQADVPAPVSPSPVALRTGGTDVAGPGAGPDTTLPPVAQPNQLYQTGLPGVTISGPASNALAPPVAAAAPLAPVTPQPAPVAPPTASQPRTGVNSPQFQKAQELNRAAADLLSRFPKSPQAQAQANALKVQAALYMQADSVSYDPKSGIGTKAITGEQVSAAKPLPHYVWDADHQAWVDTNAASPPVTPRAPALTTTKEGVVIQSEPGGKATVVYTTDPRKVAEQAAAEAQGKGVGGDVAKQLPALAAQGRNAAQSIGNIDYGMSQLAKAQQGGINTGYFAGALTEAQSALKSIGVPTDKVPFINVDPSAIGNIQTAQKTLAIVSSAILKQALGDNSQITDAKIQHFIHAQPGIETDPQALGRVLNWARSQFVYENEMSTAAMKEAADSPTGTLPLNWQARYYRDKGFAPIYDPGTGEMRQPEGQQPTREPPPGPPTTAPVNASARKADTVYQTPKGPLKWTGTGWVAP